MIECIVLIEPFCNIPYAIVLSVAPSFHGRDMDIGYVVEYSVGTD